MKVFLCTSVHFHTGVNHACERGLWSRSMQSLLFHASPTQICGADHVERQKNARRDQHKNCAVGSAFNYRIKSFNWFCTHFLILQSD